MTPLRAKRVDGDGGIKPGNLPKAKGGFAPAASKGLLVVVFALLP
jgi:hypothetical protein